MDACRHLIGISALALALVLPNMGCAAEVTSGEPEPTAAPAAPAAPAAAAATPTRALGERCWTSGAPPCAEGLVCGPDPAFAVAPAADDTEPFAGDPGVRPWICQAARLR